MPGHLVLRQHRKHGLRCQNRQQTVRCAIAQRRSNAAIGQTFDPAIMEHHGKLGISQIEQGLSISGNALLRDILGINLSFRSQTKSAITDSQGKTITGTQVRMMTGDAGNFAIAAQDRVVEQVTPQHQKIGSGLQLREYGIAFANRGEFIGCNHYRGQRQNDPSHPSQHVFPDQHGSIQMQSAPSSRPNGHLQP